MRAFVRKHKVELKYLIIGAAVLAFLVVLDRSDLLGNLDEEVGEFMDDAQGIGAVGMFLVALISNCAVFVQVPYTLPLLSAAIGGASVGNMLVLGIAAGIGAGFGEIIKYHVADRVLSKKPGLNRSKLYRWVERQAVERPRRLKWIVFVLAGSVLPDDAVIIPLAMIRYGVRRIALPLFLGKVFHNVLFAMIFYAVSDTAESFVKHGLRVDLAFGLIVAFLLVIAYQVEKAMHHEHQPETVSSLD
jgi:hypothetical protein